MTEKVTLELPEELVRQARTVAMRTRRTIDDILAEWIRLGGGEPVLELLSDEELLAVANGQWAEEDQDALSDLLDRNREGDLDPAGRARLEELMRAYRAGLVRNAQALQVAALRGLLAGPAC